MSDMTISAPLGGRIATSNLSVSLKEVTGTGMIDLRGDPKDTAFVAGVKKALGADLPTKSRTSTVSGDVKILWLSTDQWLVLLPVGSVADHLTQLAAALKGLHSLAVDVSDMRAILRISGPQARILLLKGTSLDLLSDDYGPGCVRRCRFAEIAALLDVVEADTFDLYVFRSYADYAWAWLERNGRSAAALSVFGKQPVPAV